MPCAACFQYGPEPPCTHMLHFSPATTGQAPCMERSSSSPVYFMLRYGTAHVNRFSEAQHGACDHAAGVQCCLNAAQALAIPGSSSQPQPQLQPGSLNPPPPSQKYLWNSRASPLRGLTASECLAQSEKPWLTPPGAGSLGNTCGHQQGMGRVESWGVRNPGCSLQL